MEKKLHSMQKILLRSTEFLCESLKPAAVLRNLKAKEALTPDEVTKINAKPTYAEQVEYLLDILQRKPLASYVAFMEILKTERGDLHEKVKIIERKYNFNSGNNHYNFLFYCYG